MIPWLDVYADSHLSTMVLCIIPITPFPFSKICSTRDRIIYEADVIVKYKMSANFYGFHGTLFVAMYACLFWANQV